MVKQVQKFSGFNTWLTPSLIYKHPVIPDKNTRYDACTFCTQESIEHLLFDCIIVTNFLNDLFFRLKVKCFFANILK